MGDLFVLGGGCCFGVVSILGGRECGGREVALFLYQRLFSSVGRSVVRLGKSVLVVDGF